MSTPTITQGQIAIDPRTGVLYYKNNSGTLINTSLNWSQPTGSLIQTEDSVQINSDIIISGNLTVNGTTVTVSAETVVVEDNIMVLNSNTSNANVPNTFNSGIEIERGSSVNVQLRWNESIDKWQFTNDGVNYYDIGSIETASINDLLDVVLSNSSNGEYLRYNGSNWVNDVINLGADTAGDYVGNLTSGSGITITNSGGENSNPTIAVTANTFDAFGAAATAYTNAISYANSISSNTYANAVAYVDSRTLDNLFDVNVSTAVSGDFLRYNGNTWINDPVDLSTDTVGNYVQSLVSGTGVFLSNNSGEGSTPTISIGQDVSISANVTFDTVTANFIGNITGNVSSISTHNIDELADVVITSAQNGQLLQYNGSAWVNNVLPSFEPIGHENKSQSVISFNEVSREFSIAPASGSYVVWCKGVRYVKTTTETITIPSTSGLYYIYFSNTGALSYKTTYFDWENDTPTAYIYWNQNDGKAYFFADERHGVTLDWATHEYLHRTRGAVIASGFGANGYTTIGDGSIDEHAVISIANGIFFDEDLQVDITHSATPTANTWEQRLQANAYIPVFYHSTTSWKKDTATQFPMKQGTARVQYNKLDGGTWQTLEIGNSKWGITWVVATNNLNEPVLGILGQSEYNAIGEAEAAVWEDLNLDGFPIFEFRPLYKIIYQTGGYANTPHARIQGVIDLRRVTSSGQGIPTTPVSDHGSMTGLADDDHTQYLTTNRHDAHDHTVALSTASINDLGDVTLSNSANGDFLRFNGSVWINDAVNLSTDTIGDYVANIVAGDAIEVSNTGGEGSSPTISVASGSIDGSHISSLFKYVEDVSAGNNIIINNQYIGSGQVGDFVIDTSATPSFDTVSANTITVNGYLIDPFGAQVDDVLKWNGTKFSPGIASTVAALGDLTDVSNTVPSVGDFLYWNGTTWTPSVPATGMPIVSDSAPASPIAGQLWFQSNTARTFIYYTDNSIPPDSQWVEVGTASSHPDLVVSKITQTIGNGANSYSIAHNLNTRNVLVEVYDNNTYETVTTSIARTTLDSITVSFAAPVSANAYTVVVIG